MHNALLQVGTQPLLGSTCLHSCLPACPAWAPACLPSMHTALAAGPRPHAPAKHRRARAQGEDGAAMVGLRLLGTRPRPPPLVSLCSRLLLGSHLLHSALLSPPVCSALPSCLLCSRLLSGLLSPPACSALLYSARLPARPSTLSVREKGLPEAVRRPCTPMRRCPTLPACRHPGCLTPPSPCPPALLLGGPAEGIHAPRPRGAGCRGGSHTCQPVTPGALRWLACGMRRPWRLDVNAWASS